MDQTRLTTRLTAIGARLGGAWGVSFRRLDTAERLDLNADALFTTASSIKIAILLELFRQVEAGEADLAEPVELTPGRHDTPGSGVLKELRWPLRVTLHDIAMLMIIVSDNVATNVLIDRLGMANINAGLRRLGIEALTLRRRMQDFEAIQAGRENTGSPAAFTDLLTRIERRTAISPAGCDAMLDILKRTQSAGTLRGVLPTGTVVAHKPGGLPGVVNDAGIVYASNATYAVGIYTQGDFDDVIGRFTVAAMSGVIWEHVTGQRLPGLAWLGVE